LKVGSHSCYPEDERRHQKKKNINLFRPGRGGNWNSGEGKEGVRDLFRKGSSFPQTICEQGGMRNLMGGGGTPFLGGRKKRIHARKGRERTPPCGGGGGKKEGTKKGSSRKKGTGPSSWRGKKKHSNGGRKRGKKERLDVDILEKGREGPSWYRYGGESVIFGVKGKEVPQHLPRKEDGWRAVRGKGKRGG